MTTVYPTSGRRRHRVVLALGAVVVALLSGPIADWLQGREFAPPAHAVPDAVYLVAGQRAQGSRIRALMDYLRRCDPAKAHRTLAVLIGNDPTRGRWSAADQRNLTIGEWALRTVQQGMGREAGTNVVLVPGRSWGTDAEMRRLAEFLAARPEIQSLTLVTSAYHVRRSVTRLRQHTAGQVRVWAVGASEGGRSRAPWTVLGELFKLARDQAGWADAPWISRAFYIRAQPWLDVMAWITAVLLAYAWLLYPLALALPWPARRADPREERAAAEPDWKAVHATVLIAAHNEAACIRGRLLNLLELRFPGRLEIHVGVDGAADATASLARDVAHAHPGIYVHEFAKRRGKAAVLKRLVALAAESHASAAKADAPPGAGSKSRFLVLTDANVRFRPDTLLHLLRPFHDPRVGGVCGRLLLQPRNESEAGPHVAGSPTDLPSLAESRYWRLENWLKERESRLDSCLGANGAIYAMREELFWKDLPDNTIVEDFVLGMKVRERGFRMVYEPRATAEETLPAWRSEWRRRVRIGAGDYQALCLCRACLLPRYGRWAWMFFSHKVLRWFTPHLVLLLLASSVMRQASTVEPPVTGIGWVTACVFHQVILGALAGVGLGAGLYRLSRRRGNSLPWRILAACDYLATLSTALFVGFLRFCLGRLPVAWEPTPR